MTTKKKDRYSLDVWLEAGLRSPELVVLVQRQFGRRLAKNGDRPTRLGRMDWDGAKAFADAAWPLGGRIYYWAH